MPSIRRRSMRNKPLYLKLFPIGTFLIAMSFPIQIALLYSLDHTQFIKILSMLTPLNLLSMSLFLTCSVMSLLMSKHIYKITPVLIIVILINNTIVGVYGNDYSLIQVSLSFILTCFTLVPLYAKDVVAVIKEPKLRWWLTPKRYNVRKAHLIRFKDVEIFSEILNLSKTGIFTKIKEPSMIELLRTGDLVELNISDTTDFAIKAKVVRIAKTDSNHNGLGLEIIKDKDHSEHYIPWFKQFIA